MRRVKSKKLGRSRDARKALYRSLAKALFERGSIETSVARARALSPFIHRLKSLVRSADLAKKRRFMSLTNQDKSLYAQVSRYVTKTDEKQSATRIIRLGTRLGDASERARIELL